MTVVTGCPSTTRVATPPRVVRYFVPLPLHEEHTQARRRTLGAGEDKRPASFNGAVVLTYGS
jgi:hypothetical protein